MSPPKSDPVPPAVGFLQDGSSDAAMHYYKFHVGDYVSSTGHLSNEEDLAYRRLLDMYYTSEAPIPLDTQWVSRRIRVATETVEAVLRDFFIRTEDGFTQHRCDEEVRVYQQQAERNRLNGKSGGRPKNPVGSQSVASGIPEEPSRNPNQEPVTKNQEPENQEPIVRGARGTRLKNDWVLPEEWAQWARQERPHLNLRETEEQFRDYWIAQPGTKGTKTDWAATWRNWVRRTPQAKQAVKYDWLQGNSQIIEME